MRPVFRRAFAIQIIVEFYGYCSDQIATNSTKRWQTRKHSIPYLCLPYSTLSSTSSLIYSKMASVHDPRIIAGSRVHTRARLLTSQSKCSCMYGAAWKIKLVVGTVIGMKTDKIKGRCVTSVRAMWELSDGLKEVTLRIANIKAGELIDLLDDGPEELIHQESDEFVQPEPTEDRVTSLQGTLSPSTRIYQSDESNRKMA